MAAHIQWLPDDLKVGVIRIADEGFRYREDPYLFACFVTIDEDGLAEFSGATGGCQRRLMSERRKIMAEVKALGAKRYKWERLDEGGRIRVVEGNIK
ncbi:MAG: hypothetical protein JW883_00760 [Deltaproteobacteria bacterium]|nr:hypothetical protein [Deltaproteobacteria bacterium]